MKQVVAVAGKLSILGALMFAETGLATAQVATAEKNSAIVPAERTDYGQELHKQFLDRASKGPIDLSSWAIRSPRAGETTRSGIGSTARGTRRISASEAIEPSTCSGGSSMARSTD